MILRILLIGVCILFTIPSARATVYFDSINVSGVNAGHDGLNDSTSAMAQSFSPAVADFTSITMLLSASSPLDGGSVQIFLLPDDGAGGVRGSAGEPTFGPGAGVFSHFNNAQLIGVLGDATLTPTPSAVSFSVGASLVSPVTALTNNNEYWIGLLLSTGSSAGWEFNSGSPAGIGTANQAFFNDNGGAGSILVGPGNGPYDLIVSTSEPMTLAVLGLGLASLGYIRWRTRRRS